MTIRFICLSSGSNGNCYYIGTPTGALLIDAGISPRSIRKRLKDVGIGMESILAVMVTHDHSDHIRGLGGIGEKLHIPVYATAQIHEGIRRSYCMTQKLTTSARFIVKQQPLQIGDFRVEAFEVPHDGIDNVGYHISIYGRSFTFMTDLGEVTPLAARYARLADYLIIEANYDVDMLRWGRYPAYLKERIAGPHGHLSNSATARFLAEGYDGRWQYVWLCHLSADNNRPELAEACVTEALREKGIVVGRDLKLQVLRRGMPSSLFEFTSVEGGQLL